MGRVECGVPARVEYGVLLRVEYDVLLRVECPVPGRLELRVRDIPLPRWLSCDMLVLFKRLLDFLFSKADLLIISSRHNMSARSSSNKQIATNAPNQKRFCWRKELWEYIKDRNGN